MKTNAGQSDKKAQISQNMTDESKGVALAGGEINEDVIKRNRKNKADIERYVAALQKAGLK